MLGIVCRNVGNFLGRAIGDMIVPGLGGQIGAQIGTFLGNAYAGIAGDPTAWADGISFEAECLRDSGIDPLNFL